MAFLSTIITKCGKLLYLYILQTCIGEPSKVLLYFLATYNMIGIVIYSLCHW